jgi:hypothetical protein
MISVLTASRFAAPETRASKIFGETERLCVDVDLCIDETNIHVVRFLHVEHAIARPVLRSKVETISAFGTKTEPYETTRF